MRRVFGLDLLRALAVGLVIIYHYPERPTGPLRALFNNGWAGVDLFFVLSGYLIGGQFFERLAADRAPSIGQFYFRRLTRTLPNYLVVLLGLYVFWPGLPFGSAEPLWRYLTMTQNFGGMDGFAPSWSLCVEEHFYLLFPLVALSVRRARTALAVLGGALAASVAIRAGIWWVKHPSFLGVPDLAVAYKSFANWLYYPTVTRLDGIVIGVGIGALKAYRKDLWERLLARPLATFLAGSAALAAAGLAMVVQSRMAFSGAVLGFLLLAAGFGLWLIPAVRLATTGSRLVDGAVNGLAQLSFSLYLVNLPAVELATRLGRGLGLDPRGVAQAGLFVALLLAAAAALYFLVEKPVLRLREKGSKHLLDIRRVILMTRRISSKCFEPFSRHDGDRVGPARRARHRLGKAADAPPLAAEG